MPPTEVIRFADNVFIEIAGGPGRAEPFSTARFEAVSRSFKESAAALTLVINAISDTIREGMDRSKLEKVVIEMGATFSVEGNFVICKTAGEGSLKVTVTLAAQ